MIQKTYCAIILSIWPSTGIVSCGQQFPIFTWLEEIYDCGFSVWWCFSLMSGPVPWQILRLIWSVFPKIENLNPSLETHERVWAPCDLLYAHNAGNETHLLVPYCCVCFSVWIDSSANRSDIRPVGWDTRLCLLLQMKARGSKCKMKPLSRTYKGRENNKRAAVKALWWMAGHYLCLGSE